MTIRTDSPFQNFSRFFHESHDIVTSAGVTRAGGRKMLAFHVAAMLSTSAPGASIFEFTNTSKPWIVTNDPVMGGVSNSVFKVADGLGVWTGEVKIVPFLHAPGTCQSEAAPFAPMDCSDFDAIEITLASTGALRSFQVSWGGTRFSSYTSSRFSYEACARSHHSSHV